MTIHSEGITDADLDRFEKVAEPIYRSTATAGEASRFQVSDLGMWVVRLVAEVRRLRVSRTQTDDEREALDAEARAASERELFPLIVNGTDTMAAGRVAYAAGYVAGALRRSEPAPLVASLSPATDPHEPDDARDGEENHRGDREPQVAVRGTGEHQDSAEGDRDDRDCETDPPEHRLQAAYPHRSTLAETRSTVEGGARVSEPQGEPSDAAWRAGEQSVADAAHFIANPEPQSEPSDAQDTRLVMVAQAILEHLDVDFDRGGKEWICKECGWGYDWTAGVIPDAGRRKRRQAQHLADVALRAAAQRESSDAEIDAAARAMYTMTNQLSMSGARDLARAALHAAGGVR